MFLVRREGRLQRARPAKPLQPGRDLGIIQVRIVAAGRADELERIAVAAFYPAVHDADRLAPEACCPAMARLASKWQRHIALSMSAQPQITGPGLATWGRRGYSRSGDRLITGRDIQVCFTHSIPTAKVRSSVTLKNSIRAGSRTEEAQVETDNAGLLVFPHAAAGRHQIGAVARVNASGGAPSRPGDFSNPHTSVAALARRSKTAGPMIGTGR